MSLISTYMVNLILAGGVFNFVPHLDSRHRGPQLIIKMGLAPKQFPLVLKRIQGNTSLSNLSGLSIKF